MNEVTPSSYVSSKITEMRQHADSLSLPDAVRWWMDQYEACLELASRLGHQRSDSVTFEREMIPHIRKWTLVALKKAEQAVSE